MMGMFGGMVWMLACAAFLIALVAGVVWLVVRSPGTTAKRAPRAPEHETDEDYPYQLLRRRYAAGEIDEEEYLQRLSGLSQR